MHTLYLSIIVICVLFIIMENYGKLCLKIARISFSRVEVVWSRCLKTYAENNYY